MFGEIQSQLSQWLRRWERRYLHADYAENQLRHDWLGSGQGPDTGPRTIRYSIFPKPEGIRSLLVFKPDDIGDMVHALPALQALREALPHARITVLCQSVVSGLVRRTHLADEVFEVNSRSVLRRFRTVSPVPAAKFDAAVFLRTHPSYFSSFRKVHSPVLIHPLDPRMPSKSAFQVWTGDWGERGEHQTRQMLRLVEPLTGRTDETRYPKLEWTAEDNKQCQDLLGPEIDKPYLVVHPFSKDETRQYPWAYWSDLLVRIRQVHTGGIYVIGGATDLRENWGSLGVVNLAGKLSLCSTGYLLTRARAFVGVLSGPAHLAAAVGVPTAVLWGGASYPREWSPLGNVLNLQVDVPCGPCNLRTCPGFGLKCLTELTPARVWADLREFLAVCLRSSNQ